MISKFVSLSQLLLIGLSVCLGPVLAVQLISTEEHFYIPINFIFNATLNSTDNDVGRDSIVAAQQAIKDINSNPFFSQLTLIGNFPDIVTPSSQGQPLPLDFQTVPDFTSAIDLSQTFPLFVVEPTLDVIRLLTNSIKYTSSSTFFGDRPNPSVYFTNFGGPLDNYLYNFTDLPAPLPLDYPISYYRTGPSYAMQAEPLVHVALAYGAQAILIYSKDDYGLSLFSSFSSLANLRGITIINSCSVDNPDVTLVKNSLSQCFSNGLNKGGSQGPVFLFALLDQQYEVSFALGARNFGLIGPSMQYSNVSIVVTEELYRQYFESENIIYFSSPGAVDANVITANELMQGVIGIEPLSVLSNDASVTSAILKRFYSDQEHSTHQHEIGTTERTVYDTVRSIALAVNSLIGQGVNPDELTPSLIASQAAANLPFFGASGSFNFQVNTNASNPYFAQRTISDYSILQLNVTSFFFQQDFASWTRADGITLTSDPTNQLYQNGAASNFPTKLATPLSYYYPGFFEWSSVPSVSTPPSTRFGACQVLSQDSETLVVLFGANTTSAGPIQDVYTFSFATSTWTPAPVVGSTLPRPNFYGMCVSYNDVIYTFGGVGNDGVVGEIWKYSINTRRWTHIPSFAEGGPFDLVMDRTNALSVLVNHTWYLWGGFHSSMQGEVFLKLDLTDDTGGFKVEAPDYNEFNNIQSGVTFELNQVQQNKKLMKSYLNQIYDTISVVVPGSVFNSSHRSSYIAVVGFSLSSEFFFRPVIDHDFIFLFNTNSSVWTVLYTIQQPFPSLLPYVIKGSTSGILIGRIVYVYAGSLNDKARALWALDLSTCVTQRCVWSVSSSMNNAPSSYSTPLLVGNKILLGFGNGGQTAQNFVEVVTPNLLYNARKPITVHGNILAPPARSYHTSVLLGNQYVVFGGYDSKNTALNDLWALDVDLGTWRHILSASAPPPARYGHGAGAFSTTMIIIYGTDGNNFFQDVWLFSYITSKWLEIIPSNIATNSPIPPGCAYFVNLAFGTDLLIYGGVGANSQFYSHFWRFSTVFQEWILVLDSTPGKSAFYPDPVNGPFNVTYTETNSPPALASANGDIIQTKSGNYFFFITGGYDSTFLDYPGSWSISLDNYTFGGMNNRKSLTWNFNGYMPSARHGHDAIFKGDAVFVVGGQTTPAAITTMFIYSVSHNTWDLFYTTNRAAEINVARDGISVQVVGNRIIVFGGARVDVSFIVSPSYVSAETNQLVVGPACPRASTSNLPPAVSSGTANATFSPYVLLDPNTFCSSCGPGFILVNKQCVSCPFGTYRVVNTSNVCLPCPLGTSSSMRGAVDSTFCILCTEGKYNDVLGASTCKSCSTGAYCSVGSVRAATTTIIPAPSRTDSVQANGIPDYSAMVVNYSQLAFYCLLGFVGFTLFLYYLFHFIPYKDTYLVSILIDFDWWYCSDHDSDYNKPSYNRQTPLGGYCTLLSFVVAAYFLFTLSYNYALNNYTENTALVPIVTIDTPLTVDLMITVSLSNYPQKCQVSTSSSACDPTILQIQTSGLNPTLPYSGPNPECSIQPTPVSPINTLSPPVVYPNTSGVVCQVVWHCYGCMADTALSAVSTVEFDFLETNIYAGAITWRIDAVSSYPDFDPYSQNKNDPGLEPQQNSSLWGMILSDQNNVFRGVNPPTTILTRVTPTRHTVKYKKAVSSGWTQNFVGQQPGPKLIPQNFPQGDGIKVQFNITNEITALEVTVTRNQEPDVFASNILGAITGAFGVMTMFMLWIETYFEDWLFGEKLKNNEKHLKLSPYNNLEQVYEMRQKDILDIVHSNGNSNKLGDVELTNIRAEKVHNDSEHLNPLRDPNNQ